ncbi:hypothetical protein JD844_006000 [Phrynosoma platyrhinos]|uniref:Uncharacterized protein n=1 Tax=Phrynosoma platyrhinos TaxID=52577 RepID=A0ABQ7TQ84_PHRPL|nr:hypothetical protein JD844_006000 [Phrynosoma platyrhinos]
MQCSDFALETL